MADKDVDPFAHLEGASSFSGVAPSSSASQAAPRSDYSATTTSTTTTAAGGGGGGANKNGSSGQAQQAKQQQHRADLDLDLAALDDLSLDQRNGQAGHHHDDDEDEVEELPEHACAYCGVHNTSCVVKCMGCNKW